jgi:hypothetical protein
MCPPVDLLPTIPTNKADYCHRKLPQHYFECREVHHDDRFRWKCDMAEFWALSWLGQSLTFWTPTTFIHSTEETNKNKVISTLKLFAWFMIQKMTWRYPRKLSSCDELGSVDGSQSPHPWDLLDPGISQAFFIWNWIKVISVTKREYNSTCDQTWLPEVGWEMWNVTFELAHFYWPLFQRKIRPISGTKKYKSSLRMN